MNMKQETKSAVPFWYWVIAAVALLWNLLGCAIFAMEVFAQEAGMENMTEAQKEWARSTPGWIYFVYGLAGNGSWLFLLRRRPSLRGLMSV